MIDPTHATSRRRFIRQASGFGLGISLGLTFSLSELYACSPENDRPLGIALVGLGNYSTNKLAPALQETAYCRLAGIVTGTPAKAEEWARKYDIPQKNIYNYETYDRLADNPDIDVVYVVLPNGMHAEYTIRGAQAGKHVICEKPMANSVEECRQMIDACETAGVKLQIGYRCQYDPHHQEIMRYGQEELLGQVMILQSGNGFYYGGGSDNWRFTNPALAGGGAMMDMGVYCIEGARYTMGTEPVAVTARFYNHRPNLIHPELDDAMAWQMEFENGAVANCTTGYNFRSDYLKVAAQEGNFELHPCYQYNKPIAEIDGETVSFEARNQQAIQMDAFARNIMNDTPVVADGREGLLDMKVIEAAYRSAAAGGERTEV